MNDLLCGYLFGRGKGHGNWRVWDRGQKTEADTHYAKWASRHDDQAHIEEKLTS